jgi:hypothetical protein
MDRDGVPQNGFTTPRRGSIPASTAVEVTPPPPGGRQQKRQRLQSKTLSVLRIPRELLLPPLSPEANTSPKEQSCCGLPSNNLKRRRADQTLKSRNYHLRPRMSLTETSMIESSLHDPFLLISSSLADLGDSENQRRIADHSRRGSNCCTTRLLAVPTFI